MDPYSTLGVDKNASDKDIKTAFKNLAKTHHPDRGGDESKFKQVNEAYQKIKNPSARQQHEQEQQFGQGGMQFDFGGSGFEGIFEQFFGQNAGFRRPPQQKNRNIQIALEVSLEEVFTGSKKDINIDQLGKTIKIDVPRSIGNGQTVRYRGLGMNDNPKTKAGDLLCKIYVADHPYFKRDGFNLYAEHSITCWDAIYGSSVKVRTIEGGKINLKVPCGTQPGTVMKIAQHGLMAPNTRMGDFFVRINVSIPDNLTEEDINVIRDISRKYS